MRSLIKLCFTSFFCFFVTGILLSQADLSFQGILKKSNGTAVEDGEYMMTFSLHTTESGQGSAAWTSAPLNVTVTSGIYSVILNPTVPFNTIYYMGVKVGSAPELVPRFKLTSAPYALSLIGTTNKFPSSGIVKADTLIVANKMAIGATAVATNQSLKVNGGVFAKGGAPGAAGVSNAGYAFEGTSGDNDSGLFSTADGQVAMYTDNTARLTANSTGVEVAGDVRMSSGGAISYNGVRDWQLVDVDDFSTGNDGWATYAWGTPLGTAAAAGTLQRLQAASNPFYNWFIRPDVNNDDFLLKKQFTLNNITHTEIKIEFVVFLLGTWDNELYFGGVAETLTGPTGVVTKGFLEKHQAFFTGSTIYLGSGDNSRSGQMVFKHSTNSFVLAFGAELDEGITNESFGIADIKVWVR
ncbi:MAG: hypothetical protein IPN29_02910 [Saprospiraceae bacterium]|nr:hypothetical protein [Saprospiraceae bacterium]